MSLSDKIASVRGRFDMSSTDVREAVEKLMQRLEENITQGNKLKFTHTIVAIKEIFGEKLT